MSNFENFYHELLDLIKKYERQNVPIKIEKDLDHDIIKIFGEQITSVARAKNGLIDVTELAYATAEHHPYWNLLYNCSEITSSVLEKWKSSPYLLTICLKLNGQSKKLIILLKKLKTKIFTIARQR